MGLTHASALWFWLAGAVLVALAALAFRRVRTRTRGVPLAHTSALERLPRFRVLQRRHRLLSGALAVGLAVVAVSAAVLTARPSSDRREAATKLDRDVMLCLDVSQSILDLDAVLLKKLDQITSQLRGQRIGLVAFDGGSVVKFPLTDDTAFVHQQLVDGAKRVNDHGTGWAAGAFLDRPGEESLIGDGLVSCVQRFDHQQEKRSRSVVLVTDGEPGPKQIYSVAQSGVYAAQHGVRVYIIDPYTDAHPDSSLRPGQYPTLAGVATRTHGAIFDAADPKAVPSIVSKILALQAKAIKQPPRTVRVDRPTLWVLAALLGAVVVVVAAWRTER